MHPQRVPAMIAMVRWRSPLAPAGCEVVMFPPETESVVFSLMRRIDKTWRPSKSSGEEYMTGDEALKRNVRSSSPSRTYDKGELVKFWPVWSYWTVPPLT
ncbi:hypothetical protein K438DRAFT_224904 [Mycena galopus ATCC 62051]|nr:hypothetical protein K438DRAFT_224904 [Mycena galopus ATCC 62051]